MILLWFRRLTSYLWGPDIYRGWDGWMASPTWWTWVWVNFGSWWWTVRPGVLWFMGSQRARHNWETELNWTENRWVEKAVAPPLQSSCLENPMDGGAWWAAVHGVAKSQTRLSDFNFTHWRRKWQPTLMFLPGESQGRGNLRSLGSHRVEHDWSDLAGAAAAK